MKTEIIGKNIMITKAMKTITENKLQKLNKYVILGDDVKARVLARTYRNSQKIEITIVSAVGILRSEVEAKSYYEALDLAVDKLTDQIRKQKTRLIDKHKTHIGKALFDEREAENGKENICLRVKTLHLDPMDIDSAILQMELLGHSFFAFVNEESGKPSIVYRRKDDSYGCLELNV